MSATKEGGDGKKLWQNIHYHHRHILRKVIELQQQGADIFFGEKSFEVDDLMRIDDDGRGMITILRVTDLQDRPKLFSTFMLNCWQNCMPLARRRRSR